MGSGKGKVKGSGKGKGETKNVGVPKVTPLGLVSFSRTQFIRSGTARAEVPGCSAGDALGLFLETGDTPRRAARVLGEMIRRQGPVVAAIGAARNQGIERLKDIDPKTDLRRAALRAAAWFGVLLHHAGRDAKGAGMSEAGDTKELGFLLGQFLTAADRLHVGYCADMRGGNVPPDLLGSSVLSLAGRDPTAALAVLSQRLGPYQKWARRGLKPGEYAEMAEKAFRKVGEKGNADAMAKANAIKANAIRKALIADRFMARTCVPLKDALPHRTGRAPDDAFRAELLLGYLADPQPKTKDPTAKDGDAVAEAINAEQEDDAE